MFDTIVSKLPEIEKQHQVKLLYVAESGSRAWGMASTDSDYDVRGIFIHPRYEYLSIDKPKETFEWIEDNWFDVGAWDIVKALNLLRKSNSVLLEWLQSPIVYYQYSSVQTELLELAQEYYQPKAALYHYRGIAKMADIGRLDNAIKLKKWFYLLRALLAAYWSATQQVIPPMELKHLLSMLTAAEQNEINELVQFKATKDEHFLWTPTITMQQLINRLWQDTSNSIEIRKTPDSQLLNYWFRTKLDEISY